MKIITIKEAHIEHEALTTALDSRAAGEASRGSKNRRNRKFKTPIPLNKRADRALGKLQNKTNYLVPANSITLRADSERERISFYSCLRPARFTSPVRGSTVPNTKYKIQDKSASRKECVYSRPGSQAQFPITRTALPALAITNPNPALTETTPRARAWDR